MSDRTANYRDDEDIILGQAYMEVSQEPITGISQTSNSLKERKYFMLTLTKKNFKNGFKFDHVWNILKDFENFEANSPPRPQISRKHPSNHVSSQSDNQSPNCDTPDSTGFSQFFVDLNDDDDNVGSSSPQRPIGVKKNQTEKKK
ncbi:hypothetical protein BUALT_Bualt09G0134800 [Buddleja alternifolia]|uniref:No apical meristem-associated C-terminal domain-containing protein n=1 Tax=Buddleja alternifolia TaxID=168488 RepID=A0AAV6X2E2_9LAMI|nr:hypothetical protein BUALT_Bualt09G0134800 [Buddleja alternifolia]